MQVIYYSLNVVELMPYYTIHTLKLISEEHWSSLMHEQAENLFVFTNVRAADTTNKNAKKMSEYYW